MFGKRCGFAARPRNAAALACGVTIGILAATALARATDIMVTEAKIEQGKLVVTGTTLTANTQVKLDSLFTATSNGSKVFTFTLVYHPVDCVVDLVTVGSTATPTRAVVADCGANGVNPLRSWISTKQYLTNDVVVSGGSSWRAKAPNIGKPPAANLAYWEQFVGKGPTGAQGPAGVTKNVGVKKVKGDTVPAGSTNPNCSEGQVVKWASGKLVCASRSTLPCCSVYE
jgi:hypothetical protein